MREFANHFFGNYIAVHSTFAQTLWRLIARPGALTVDYLEGRKRRYILPLRLYLTISVIVFVVFGLLTSVGQNNIELSLKSADLSNGNVFFFDKDHSATFKDGVVTCVGLPDWLCNRMKSRFGSTNGFKNLLATLPDRMVKYWAYAMFFLVPVFALLLRLAYINRKRVYGEHLVFALHLHTFWLLAVAGSLLHDWAALIATFAIPVYAVLAMRRVYADSGWRVLFRAALISFLYVIISTMAVGVVAIVALLL